MAERGGGAIVNQLDGRLALLNYYGLAKAGMNALTQQLSRELGWQNIRINAIAPGPIDTAANHYHSAADPRRHRVANTAEPPRAAGGCGRNVSVSAVRSGTVDHRTGFQRRQGPDHPVATGRTGRPPVPGARRGRCK